MQAVGIEEVAERVVVSQGGIRQRFPVVKVALEARVVVGQSQCRQMALAHCMPD